MKVFFIGNIPTNDPRSIGGASSLTYNLLAFLKRNNAPIEYYELRKNWKPKGQILDYLFFLLKFPFISLKYDVISIHGTRDFRISIGPFIVLFSKLFNKRIVCHFYGGYFHKKYMSYPRIFKWWLEQTIFRSDLILMETKEQVAFFNNLFDKDTIIWFPNARNKQNIDIKKEYSKKLVFISRVTEQKGIKILIEVFKELPSNYTLAIYGPIEENLKKFISNIQDKQISYHGSLTPDTIIPTLLKYDILILPTLHPNEGYPGIIIEALSCGKPVISSNLISIAEIIENGKEGILTEQGNKNQLMQAIKAINTDNYQEFSAKALTKFELFDEEIVFNKLLNFYLND
ncbi:MAG: glycosyltransferase family 4 protein [Flavobacteriaceae bacterium]